MDMNDPQPFAVADIAPTPTFDTVREFERRIAAFFGVPSAVAVDSCTHGLELCLRYKGATFITSPTRTYVSVPMLANKMGIQLNWVDFTWESIYGIGSGIYDAATLWQPGSYRPGKFMCISFQYQKHLSLGRGGMILCPDEKSAADLRKMAYDGREPGIPWREQNIATYGFHYYMVPETAQMGLDKLDTAIATPPRIWTSADYPDVSKFDVWKNI